MEVAVNKKYLAELPSIGIVEVVIIQKTKSGMFIFIDGRGVSKWIRTADFIAMILEEI